MTEADEYTAEELAYDPPSADDYGFDQVEPQVEPGWKVRLYLTNMNPFRHWWARWIGLEYKRRTKDYGSWVDIQFFIWALCIRYKPSPR